MTELFLQVRQERIACAGQSGIEVGIQWRFRRTRKGYIINGVGTGNVVAGLVHVERERKDIYCWPS